GRSCAWVERGPRIARGERRSAPRAATPLVPLALTAPPPHPRRQAARPGGAAGQRGVAGREEHQVAQIGAGQAQWPRVVHPQELTSTAALGARPIPDRPRHHQPRGSFPPPPPTPLPPPAPPAPPRGR